MNVQRVKKADRVQKEGFTQKKEFIFYQQFLRLYFAGKEILKETYLVIEICKF